MSHYLKMVCEALEVPAVTILLVALVLNAIWVGYLIGATP